MAKRKRCGKRSQHTKKLRHLRQHIPTLRALIRAKPATRIKLLKNSDKRTVDVIVEIVKNLLHGNINLSKQQYQKLKQKRASLRNFVQGGSLKSRRRALTQKGGFLPALIPLLAPLVTAVGGALFGRR